MIRYVFKCDDCGVTFEGDFRIKDRDKPLDEPCPQCEVKGKVRRTITSSRFILKGSGWAKDGYSDLFGNTQAYKDAKKNTGSD